MHEDILSFSEKKKKALTNKDISSPIINSELRFDGYNEDFTEAYHWHFNFMYYVGKGYAPPLKLEDHHYFSETSQFGMNMRQIKGGSIRAFQENFQQLIQLVRSHLLPLLNEVKNAAFYKDWLSQITDNDKIVQDLISRGTPLSDSKLKLALDKRNEAINHIKDKWVMEVDGGRIWQMNRSATEQGLDYALLPQLFFGTNLIDPLQKRKSLKEQLDEDIYSIDISTNAKEAVARFMFRFYTWLPTAIADTNVTFKLKISALKNIYSQVQMYINFMKPLLIEITRKTEGLEKSNFYNGFELENPDFVNLFDFSYSYVKTLGIRNYQRGKKNLKDLEFTPFGLFIDSKEIMFGPNAGKTGFIAGVENNKYILYPHKEKDIDYDKFNQIKEKKILVEKTDLRTFPVMEIIFSQRRRSEVKQTQQGPQAIPYMRNKIEYKGYVWNIYEIASYRESLKVDDLLLLESFIEELSIVREDLMKYIKYHGSNNPNSSENKNSNFSTSESKKVDDEENYSLTLSPFKGLGEIFSPLIPKLFEFKELKKKREKSSFDSEKEKHHFINEISVAEDTWKVYTVFKKTHRLMQY